MINAGRLLVDLAKLNLDERAQRINELTARLAHGVILRALSDIGLDETAMESARPAIARRLRLAAVAAPDRTVPPAAASAQ